jgi:hypothetical protein
MKRLLPAALCLGLLLTSLVADEPGKPPVAAAPKEQTNAQEGPFPMPEMTAKRTDVKPFAYVDVGKKIPNYTPSRVWGVQGEPLSQMQVPPPAEESIKHLVVPKGFHPELFASEEQLGGGTPSGCWWSAASRTWCRPCWPWPAIPASMPSA